MRIATPNKVICIFVLDNVVDAHSCRAYTEKYAGKEPQDAAVYMAELQRRVTVLHNNKEAIRLHEQLVGDKIIEDDEFWAKRKNLLQAVACEPTNQQTGLESVILSYQLMSGLQETENAQIKSEIIEQIFTEKPMVLREFLTKVPNPMTEPEFWKKFFTAEKYRRRENIALGRAEAYVDSQLAIFLEDDDIVADEVQHKIGSVDPTIDMVEDFSDDYTHLQGHGTIVRGNDDNVGVVIDKLQEALFHDINRHAMIVLEGRAIDSKVHNTTEIAEALDKSQRAKRNIKGRDELIQKYRIQKANKMVEIDDLQMPREFYVPLHVEDSRQYSASLKANDLGVHVEHMDVDSSNVYADLQKISLKIKNKGLNNPIVKSDVTFKHLEVILELLWHFWASYPPTNESLNNKGNQLKEAITQRYQILQKMIKSLQSDVKHQISLLLQPMLQAIGLAIDE